MTANSDTLLIRRLREENDELREEIRQLRERVEERLGQKTLPRSWAITPTMRSILLDLSYGGTVPFLRLWENATLRSKNNIGRERCGRKHNRTEDPIGSIRVVVSKSRKRLLSLGIEIKAEWGVGYYLPPESLEVVRNALVRGSAHSDEQEQEQCPEA